jgi:hypothetical protein
MPPQRIEQEAGIKYGDSFGMPWSNCNWSYRMSDEGDLSHMPCNVERVLADIDANHSGTAYRAVARPDYPSSRRIRLDFD